MDAAIKNALLGICPTLAKRPEYLDPPDDSPKPMHCDQCEMLAINGVPCHETGCPDAWKDHLRECKWCGQDFRPSGRYHITCSRECAEAYYG